MSWSWAVAAGVVLGVVYTLSPLAVLCTAAVVLVTRWAAKGLTGRERAWFLTLFIIAILSRYLVVAVLFLIGDESKPYAVFFGDEWIFKSRPIWLRNVGLGVPISAADFIYAYDPTGMSGHIYALALLQAIVGDAPYGVHIFNIALYVAAVAILYRLVRPAFGALVAFGGSAVLLALPSLFAWSVSALKEPIYVLTAVIELLLVLTVARAPRLAWRVVAAAALAPVALAMEELRNGTLVIAAFGAVAGWAGAWTVKRPVRIAMAAATVPVVLVLLLAQAPVYARLMDFSRELMRYHAGHVMTPGVSYRIIDPMYYGSRSAEVRNAGWREVLRYMLRAPIAYVVEPSPRNIQSRQLWLYLPEHFLWLVLIGLVPFGLLPAFQRDRLLAAVLLAHAVAIVMMVALTSGNIGTLIRHRGLSLPYLVWFSMLGAAALFARAAATRPAEGSVTDGHR